MFEQGKIKPNVELFAQLGLQIGILDKGVINPGFKFPVDESIGATGKDYLLGNVIFWRDVPRHAKAGVNFEVIARVVLRNDKTSQRKCGIQRPFVFTQAGKPFPAQTALNKPTLLERVLRLNVHPEQFVAFPIWIIGNQKVWVSFYVNQWAIRGQCLRNVVTFPQYPATIPALIGIP